MGRLAIAGTLLMVVTATSGTEAGGLVRHAGLLQSLDPAEGVLTIEEVGVNGTTDLLQVRIRGADVVRVWRDPAEPWQWRERPTRIHRWPAGTFVVVVGTTAPSGVIDATRVELPKLAPE